MKKKKIEQKEKAKTDNISNHSDDTNQKIRTKKVLKIVIQILKIIIINKI